MLEGYIILIMYVLFFDYMLDYSHVHIELWITILDNIRRSLFMDKIPG